MPCSLTFCSADDDGSGLLLPSWSFLAISLDFLPETVSFTRFYSIVIECCRNFLVSWWWWDEELPWYLPSFLLMLSLLLIMIAALMTWKMMPVWMNFAACLALFTLLVVHFLALTLNSFTIETYWLSKAESKRRIASSRSRRLITVASFLPFFLSSHITWSC